MNQRIDKSNLFSRRWCKAVKGKTIAKEIGKSRNNDE
jgi:hypothetical protein